MFDVGYASALYCRANRDTTMIEKVYQHTFPSIMEGYANQLRQYGNDFLKNATQNINATRNAT